MVKKLFFTALAALAMVGCNEKNVEVSEMKPGEKIHEKVLLLSVIFRLHSLDPGSLLFGKRHYTDALATRKYRLKHFFRCMRDEYEKSAHRRLLNYLKKSVGRLLIHLLRKVEDYGFVTIRHRSKR